MINWRCGFLCISIALPWLNPFTPGPSGLVVSLLVSLLCAGLVLALSASAMPSRISSIGFNYSVTWFFLAAGAYFLIHMTFRGFNLEGAATLVAWISVLGLALSSASWVQAEAKINQNADFLPNSQTVLQPAGLLSLLPYVAITWLIVASLSVLIGMVQFLHAEHIFSPWISEVGDSGSAISNLRQRNLFSTLCGIGLISLGYLAHISSATQNRLLRYLCSKMGLWIFAVALALGNAMSGSRTGLVEWILIALGVYWFRSSLRKSVFHLILGSLIIYLAWSLAMPWIADAFGNTDAQGVFSRKAALSLDHMNGGRWGLYSNVVELIASKPWFGWGWGSLGYALYSGTFERNVFEGIDNAHNLPLHLAVELGLPFAIVFCLAISWWVYTSKPWRETNPSRLMAWGVLMLLGVHSMVELPLWTGSYLMTLGICIGILSAGERSACSIAIKKISYGLSLTLLVLFVCLAIDYRMVSQIYLQPENRYAIDQSQAMQQTMRSVIFQRYARFAQLLTMPRTPDAAPYVFSLASDAITFTQEPRVIEALIVSASMQGLNAVAKNHLENYKRAYPKDYARWVAQMRKQ
jgi:Virulence factor membrane-bound polymerase, C-terminal/O-Antigen ligase/Protein glycosylation ligase